MASKKSSPPPVALNEAPGASRLGLVLRLRPGSGRDSIKKLEHEGLRIAASSDFKAAASVPNDFGGADIQYFERLGFAVVRGQVEKVSQMRMVRDKDSNVSSRPELRYVVQGGSNLEGYSSAVYDVNTHEQPASYWIGYRDAVNHVVDMMIQNSRSKLLLGAPQSASARNTTWGLQAVGADISSYTGRGIKVAVLDTGFDHLHPDFAGRSIHKKLFVSKNSEDDLHGHGTHCVGTACGFKMSSTGMRYGVAYGSEIYAGKVLGDDGFGTDRSIFAGIEWALSERCDIISMSLGSKSSLGDVPNADYEQIGRVCMESGALVIAAAGNESRRPSYIAPVGSPANASAIMAVAAIDEAMVTGVFSCGSINPGQAIDLAGPGVKVFSSTPKGGYDTWNGTSMATPHVSGVAALWAEKDPSLRGQALWAQLIRSCQYINQPQRDVGVGLVQSP